MYSSRRAGQSFHDQNEASGDFGPRASTVRFRAPLQPPSSRPEISLAELAEEVRLEQERAAQVGAAAPREQVLEGERRTRGVTIRPLTCREEARRGARRRPRRDPSGASPATACFTASSTTS